MTGMNLFKCQTIAQFKIGMWLVEHGIEKEDIASIELLAINSIRVANPAGQFMEIVWRDNGIPEIV